MFFEIISAKVKHNRNRGRAGAGEGTAFCSHQGESAKERNEMLHVSLADTENDPSHPFI